MQKKNNTSGFSSKGYYIALGLCAVAIAITGILYYRNAEDEPQLQNPDITVSATVSGEDVQAVATQPKPTDTPTQPTETEPPAPMQTAAPVEGERAMPYAMSCLSYNPTTRDWRTHNGVDIAAEAGTFVTAAAAGTVYTVYEDETMGMTVVITHQDGYTTKYASLSQEVLVQPGDTVRVGQQIGTVGTTALMESAIGDHVHFSVMKNDNPVDPDEFLAMN